MNNIKTLIISLAGCLLLSLPLTAQPVPSAPGESVPPGHQNKEKLESARIAYFTSRMNLTPDEAAKFWPVYNEYRKAMDEARRANRGEFHELRRMTEEGNASEVNMKKHRSSVITSDIGVMSIQMSFFCIFILPISFYLKGKTIKSRRCG